MTTEDLCQKIAARFAVAGHRACVKGTVVLLEIDSDAGWITAGDVRVTAAGTVEFTNWKRTQRSLGLTQTEADEILSWKADTTEVAGVPNLAADARDYRAGKVVAEDLVVACVGGGYLTAGEAMNRDW